MTSSTNGETPVAHSHPKHYDPVGMRLGMWLFLFTEILLFGGLFIAYSMYAHMYKRDFILSSGDLSRVLGTTNTLVLLTSSLTMVLAVASMQKGERRRAVYLVLVTIACGLTFLVIKGFEWGHKFEHGIYPSSDMLLKMPHGSIIFIYLYFAMTGLHALHVIVGTGLLSTVGVLCGTGRITPERHILLENSALYWHLVDVIWIFLFPLFYLIV